MEPKIPSWDPRTQNPWEDSERGEEKMVNTIEDSLQVQPSVEKEGKSKTQCADGDIDHGLVQETGVISGEWKSLSHPAL